MEEMNGVNSEPDESYNGFAGFNEIDAKDLMGTINSQREEADLREAILESHAPTKEEVMPDPEPKIEVRHEPTPKKVKVQVKQTTPKKAPVKKESESLKDKNGKDLARRKKVFHEDDDIDEMRDATMELFSTTTRKALKKVTYEEKDHIRELINRTYYPTKDRHTKTREELIKAKTNFC